MAKKPERYYTADNPEFGVTGKALKRLPRAEQFAYMQYWFERNFEDPANSTPYISAEGGYQYIWGGPYDASDALHNEFGGFLAEARIDEMVSKIQSEGTYDWAPTPHHPDRRGDQLESDDAFLQFAEASEFDGQSKTAQNDIQNKASELIDLIKEAAPVHGGIGHNNPPDESPLDDDAIANAIQSLDKIRSEFAKDIPDQTLAEDAASNLKIAGLSVSKWIARKADLAADEFSKQVGKKAATAVQLYALWPLIHDKLNHLMLLLEKFFH